MAQEVVESGQITKENLKAWFDAAFFETSVDDSGNLHIRDGFDCYVMPYNNGAQVRLVAALGTTTAASRDAIHDFANRVNNGKIIVRATVRDDRAILFDYYVSVEGGTTRKNVVLTTKRWIEIVKSALQLDTDKVLDVWN